MAANIFVCGGIEIMNYYLPVSSLEILMAVWILSNIQARLCAIIQILVVLMMNVFEFFPAQDLLVFWENNSVKEAPVPSKIF
jgi:hypothetical protein